jgi:hypothetical protein
MVAVSRCAQCSGGAGFSLYFAARISQHAPRMSHRHNLQFQRFELKYIVSPAIARQVRNFVRSYLEADEHAEGKPNFSYAIHSLYLDSERLSFFWHTVSGNKNRFKLRLRFYDDAPDSPVFFEIKRREGDVIRKQRAAVRRDAVAGLLVGQLPHAGDLFRADAKSEANLREFCRLMQPFNARPTARVSYWREAWVSPDNDDLRITLDREIRCWPQHTDELSGAVLPGAFIFGQTPVVEIKFTCRFPDWVREMVCAFGMTRVSAAKYADGIQTVGEHHFTRIERKYSHERMAVIHR